MSTGGLTGARGGNRFERRFPRFRTRGLYKLEEPDPAGKDLDSATASFRDRRDSYLPSRPQWARERS
jgi:hypothetical protein